jgi:hypothetical protein
VEPAIRARNVGFPYVYPKLQIQIGVELVLPAYGVDGFV